MRKANKQIQVEALEGRALLAELIPQLRPIAFQVGHFTAISRRPGGEITRSEVDIQVAPDGQSFVASRDNAPPGVPRLWTTSYDQAGGQIVHSRTSPDGRTFSGVWSKVRPGIWRIEGLATSPDGSSTPERMTIRQLGRGVISYTMQVADGDRLQTVETGIRRRV